MRRLSQECNVSEKTIRRAVKDDLQMRSFKLQKRHKLSNAQIEKRKLRVFKILEHVDSGISGEIVWSDEKLFMIESAHNHQNDRAIGKSNFFSNIFNKSFCAYRFFST